MVTMVNAIEQLVRGIVGAMFCKVDYITENHGLLKTSKVDGTINPLWNRQKDIRKVVKGSQINLGTVYGRIMEKRVDKVTGKEIDFVPQAMLGKVEHTIPHKNLCISTDASKVYIRYLPMKNNNIEVKYMLDGQDVTSLVWNYRRPSTAPSTQTAVGLDDETKVDWRTLDITRITRFEAAGVVIE